MAQKPKIRTRTADQREHWLEIALGVGVMVFIAWYVLRGYSTTQAQALQGQQDVPITAGVAGYNYYWPGQYGSQATSTVSSNGVTAPGLGLNAGGSGSPITITTSPLQSPAVPSWTYLGLAPGGSSSCCSTCDEAQGV